MKIRSKQHVQEVMENFQDIFKFDILGQKHYLFFPEKDTDYTLTIMKYAGGNYTLNRRNASVSDGEYSVEKEEIERLIWVNRAAINKVMELIKD